MTNESFENGILELRRGVIVLAVMSRLNQEQYGYSLIKGLAEALGKPAEALLGGITAFLRKGSS